MTLKRNRIDDEYGDDDDDVVRYMARRRKSAKVGDAMHVCWVCCKEFKRPCDLTKHEKTHSLTLNINKPKSSSSVYMSSREWNRKQHQDKANYYSRSFYSYGYNSHITVAPLHHQNHESDRLPENIPWISNESSNRSSSPVEFRGSASTINDFLLKEVENWKRVEIVCISDVMRCVQLCTWILKTFDERSYGMLFLL
jgi:hypothetical protein